MPVGCSRQKDGLKRSLRDLSEIFQNLKDVLKITFSLTRVILKMSLRWTMVCWAANETQYITIIKGLFLVKLPMKSRKMYKYIDGIMIIFKM